MVKVRWTTRDSLKGCNLLTCMVHVPLGTPISYVDGDSLDDEFI